MNLSSRDQDLMNLAIDEARKSTRSVRPNPRVGAVLVTKSGVVLKDFHKIVGGPHAEREVMSQAHAHGIDTAGAELFVTLEPCCHTGRTPPCTDAILQSGVRRVVFGVADPFEKVAGQGAALLKSKGLEVVEGVCRADCEEVNREWLFAHRNKRPHVTLKMATSMDGLWSAANGDSHWITGSTARDMGHSLRARVDALLTGAQTVRSDNPSFTARPGGIVADPLQQPQVFVLYRSEPPNLTGTALVQHPKTPQLIKSSNLNVLLADLYVKQLFDVMIEAGPSLSAAFLREGLVDELWHFQSPRFLGGDGARFRKPFGRGLAGLEFEILEMKKLSPEADVFFRLCPKSTKS